MFLVTFSLSIAQNERIFATFAFRIDLFGYIGPIVFRTILKYDNNNTRMTKATKLTPSLAWALVVFNNVRVEESYPLDGLLLYEGARAFIFKRRFTNGIVIRTKRD